MRDGRDQGTRLWFFTVQPWVAAAATIRGVGAAGGKVLVEMVLLQEGTPLGIKMGKQ